MVGATEINEEVRRILSLPPMDRRAVMNDISFMINCHNADPDYSFLDAYFYEVRRLYPGWEIENFFTMMDVLTGVGLS